MKLIGLCGRSGSGKDFCGELLFYRWGFYPVALADQLKVAVMQLQDWSYSDVFVKKPEHVRTYLQDYGVRRRDIDPQYWIRALEAWLHRWESRWKVSRWVVTDVRFPNEVQWVQESGGIVVGIDSDRTSGLTPMQAAHESETEITTAIQAANYRIENNKETLRNNVELQLEMALRAAGWAN